MELLDLSRDVLRQIMIQYIDNSEINKIKVRFIGSKIFNDICDDIQLINSDMYVFMNDPRFSYIYEDTEYVDINGNTALILAIKSQIDHVVLKILDDVCKPEQVNKFNDTALTIACRCGMSKVALKILDISYKPNYKCNECDVLLYACNNDMPDVVLKLLNIGFDIKREDQTRITALIYSCKNQMSDFALKLLDAGCVPIHANTYDFTALYYACKNNMSEVALKLLDVVEIYALQYDEIYYDPIFNMTYENNMIDVADKLKKLINYHHMNNA